MSVIERKRGRFPPSARTAAALLFLIGWLPRGGQAVEPSAAEVDDAQLAAVVVTAARRPQAGGEVPISMTVLRGYDIEKARGATLEDIQPLVSNFSVEQQSGFNVLTLRGVGGGGRNIGFDPRVGVYVDGVYLGQAQALRQPLLDVEQVEILQGPQGDLFGRNTVAGAVSVNTREPGREFESRLRTVAGNKGIREAYATVSGALAEPLLGRLAVSAETRDGFGSNLFDGRKLDDLDRYSLRGRLVALVDERSKLSLGVDASRFRQNQVDGESTSDLFGQPLAGGSPPRRTMNVDTTPSEAVDLAGAHLGADTLLPGGQRLKAILGYRDTRQRKRMDNDYGPADLLRTLYVDRYRQSSAELRIASPDGQPMGYVAGLYRSRESARTDRKAYVGRDADTALVRFPDAPDALPLGPVLGIAPGGVASNEGVVDTDTLAAFGAVDIPVAAAWMLHAGTRYTRESKRLRFDLDGAAGGALDIGTLRDYRDTRSDGHWSPSIALSHALDANHRLYARYARAFKSGGWNVEFLSSASTRNPAFGTETADSYEIGAKGRSADGRLRYQFAAYDTRYRNFQVFQFVDLGAGGTSIELRNAAEALTRGVEGELAWRPMPRLHVGLRAGTADATFRSFANCSTTVDCGGHRLPYAPKYSAALIADYDLPLAGSGGLLRLHGEYSRRGSAFADPVNDPATQGIPGRELVNLRAAWLPSGSRWQFAVWVRNLFGKDTVIARERDFLGNQLERRLDPRTFGVEARFDL
jgi:iron complex outermembrane receptor protein